MKSLLIRGTNWIGDSIMCLPALRELRQQLPDTQITLMVRPWVSGIFQGLDCIDAVLECDTAEGWWNGFNGNVVQMRQGKFDAALLFPNAIAPALQAAYAGIPQRMGYSTDGRGYLLTKRTRKTPRLDGRHQCYEYLDLLHLLELSSKDYLADTDFVPDTSLHWSDSIKRNAMATAARFGILEENCPVGIHAGAYYGSAKQWFPDSFARVADALVDSHEAHIILFGSGVERPLAKKIISVMKHPARTLAGQIQLVELLQLMSQCRLIITNDSGPMHLASSLDVPLVALFGSTDAVATGPLSPRARIIRKEVACSPCLLRECPLDLRCFSQITEREVIAIARDQLEVY